MLIISSESACDICLDQYSSLKTEPASLKCGHCFCRSCIYTLSNRVCPICREPFSVTTDLHKIHVDYASAKSLEVLAHERSALKACGSGDVLSIEADIMTIEDWLQTQAPGFHCSLPTIVELMRLVVDATSQLHSALQSAQSEESFLKQQNELNELKWAAEKRRLEQEIAALRVGLSRQRDHLAYLETKLQLETYIKASPTQVTAVPMQFQKPTSPRIAVNALPSPTSPPTTTPHLSSPPPLSLTPIIMEGTMTKDTEYTRRPPEGATLLDTPVSAVSPTSPSRPPRAGYGPRERTSANPRPRIPSGAAPSAFIPVSRQPTTSQGSHQSASHDSLRPTSLPPIKRPEHMGFHSYDSITRKQRYSAQPTSWRHEFFQESSLSSKEEENYDSSSSLGYLHSLESSSMPHANRSSIAETPSLSRKRALRRQSKD